MRWAAAASCLLLPAVAAASTTTDQIVCDGLAPAPWPATVVERRLHLRRMESARDQCIGHPAFLSALGSLWLDDGDPEQARVWLERSLMLDPDHLGTLADHALALAALGEPAALNELAAAWRLRNDVPAALRQRIAAALDPSSWSRLPTARLGGAPKKPLRRSRGEASMMLGYENNLAISPTLTELTLTPPEGEVVLPVTSTPRKGAAVKADLSWQSAWELSPSSVVRYGLSGAARSAPGESSTDWHQAQGAVSITRQANGLSASLQTDLSWLGGALTEPYALARLRLVLEHQGENCSTALQLEADDRRQSQTRSADSLTELLAWRLQCRPTAHRNWQWSLSLRSAVDRPRGDERPGGEQRSWGAVARVQYRLSALGSVDVSLGTSRIQDQLGYSPLLDNNAIRQQSQTFLAAELARAVDMNWMPGAEWVVQFTRFRQSSNLALFRHSGMTAYTGLRWPW